MRLNFDKCNVCTGGRGGCVGCADNPLEDQRRIGSSSLDKQFSEALGPYERPGLEENKIGTREDMSQEEIDKMLGLEKKKVDSLIDEAISEAFI